MTLAAVCQWLSIQISSHIPILFLIFNSNPYQENDEAISSDDEMEENKEKKKVHDTVD